MIKYLVLIFVPLLLGCGAGTDLTAEVEDNETQRRYSFLALGDSYTIGEGVAEEERWPVQLVHRLRERGYAMAPPKIIARTGWTTRNLLNAIEDELHYTRKFDLVSVSIGVNNQYQGKTRAEYEEELREVFRLALNYSKRREKGVFALSIPDYSVTPFVEEKAGEISAEIDRFNTIFRRVAQEHGVTFFNITPISREAGRDPDLVAEDGLHPSGTMYRYWVEEIIDEIKAQIPKQAE